MYAKLARAWQNKIPTSNVLAGLFGIQSRCWLARRQANLLPLLFSFHLLTQRFAQKSGFGKMSVVELTAVLGWNRLYGCIRFIHGYQVPLIELSGVHNEPRHSRLKTESWSSTRRNKAEKTNRIYH